jgi:hypothetical protein
MRTKFEKKITNYNYGFNYEIKIWHQKQKIRTKVETSGNERTIIQKLIVQKDQKQN